MRLRGLRSLLRTALPSMGSALAAKTIVARVPAAIGSVLLIPATFGRRRGRLHRPRCPFRELAEWADRPIAARRTGTTTIRDTSRPTTYAGVVIAVDAAELLDLSDPDVVADPYPAFAALAGRGAGRLARAASDLGRDQPRRLQPVLRDRRSAGSSGRASPTDDWETFNWLHADSILDSEPPKHTRLRRLVQSAFSRGHVARLGPGWRSWPTGLLDDCGAHLDADGSFDVIADLAEPLPVLVIAELLGWPEADRHLLRPWSQAIVKMYELNRTPEQEAEARRGERRVRRIRRRALAADGSAPWRTTCSPTWSRSATAATGCRRTSWWRPRCCCSTPATRRASTGSATGWRLARSRRRA